MEPKSGKSSKTGNPWMIQEYVLEIPGQYPRRCMFSIYGEERIKQMNVQMGEDLTIQFDIDARQYNGRWYNDIKVYNVIRNLAGDIVGSIYVMTCFLYWFMMRKQATP